MAEKPVNTLAKSERICGKKSIEALLAGGRWGNAGVIKYCWRRRELGDEALDGPRMMVSVSKRFFKRAVRRNLLKRRIREAYRLQKSLLGAAGVDIMFVYNSKEILGFDAIFASVGQILTAVSKNSE